MSFHPRYRGSDTLSVEQIPETLTRKQPLSRPETSTDVLVVGAGPTGMACAIEAQKAGFKALIIDKGCLVNSIYHYPNNMVFFTTPELLEIGDVPFTTASPNQAVWKPSNTTGVLLNITT